MAKKEGYDIEERLLRQLLESNMGDIRHSINQLQLWHKGSKAGKQQQPHVAQG
jgi:DNA polymerase III delta prime subunit